MVVNYVPGLNAYSLASQYSLILENEKTLFCGA